MDEPMIAGRAPLLGRASLLTVLSKEAGRLATLAKSLDPALTLTLMLFRHECDALAAQDALQIESSRGPATALRGRTSR